MNQINIPHLKCLRCKHQWIPRSSNYPKVCPNCNSPYWDKKRRSEIMKEPKKKLTKKDSPKEYEEVGELTGSGL